MNKDKTVAGILAILLGAYGVHKFYLGNTSAGIAYLLITLFCIFTSWIFIPLIVLIALQIIAIVEGIKMLTESEEQFADRIARKPFFL